MPRSCVHSRRCTCKTDTLEKVTTEPDTRKCNKCTHASSRRLYLLCLVMDISYLVLSTRAYRRILGKRQDAKGSTKRPSPFTWKLLFGWSQPNKAFAQQYQHLEQLCFLAALLVECILFSQGQSSWYPVGWWKLDMVLSLQKEVYIINASRHQVTYQWPSRQF